MAEKTRGRVFSVARDTGHEYRDAPNERTSNAGRPESERRRQKADDGCETPRPRFCTTFVDVEAWLVSENYGAATEGEERYIVERRLRGTVGMFQDLKNPHAVCTLIYL